MPGLGLHSGSPEPADDKPVWLEAPGPRMCVLSCVGDQHMDGMRGRSCPRCPCRRPARRLGSLSVCCPTSSSPVRMRVTWAGRDGLRQAHASRGTAAPPRAGGHCLLLPLLLGHPGQGGATAAVSPGLGLKEPSGLSLARRHAVSLQRPTEDGKQEPCLGVRSSCRSLSRAHSLPPNPCLLPSPLPFLSPCPAPPGV